MANTKPKSSAPSSKVFDVAKPGKSAPSSSSKPIIITNRPVLKDPMVTAEKPVDDAPTILPKKIKISPLTDDEPDTLVKVTAEESIPEEPEVIDTPAPEEPAEVEAVTALPSEQAAEAISTPAKTVAEPKAGEKPAATQVETPVETEAESSEAELVPDDVQQTAQNKDDAALRAEAKREAELQKVIDSKQYYLPINSVKKHRNKRNFLLALLLIVILAVVWADIALDSGMIHLQGVKPLTHFFNQ